MRRFFVILLLMLMASCAKAPKEQTSELLRTVPSRSVELMCFRKAGPALELLLDSTHVFRRLKLGRLVEREMVLSYDYSSTLVPLLSIDAGRARKDTSEAVKLVLQQAKELKLQMALSVDSLNKSSALLISPSTAAIAEALIHINAGTSILDAPGFMQTAEYIAGAGTGTIVLRHTAAERIVPKGFLSEIAPRKKTVKFFSDLCLWSVLTFPAYNTHKIKVNAIGIDATKYLSVFSGIKASKSTVNSILPDSTSFFVTLPLSDATAFYKNRCAYLDAKSTLRSHKNKCAAIQKQSGVNPLVWLSHLKEVAIISWNGHSVLALRVKKPIASRKQLSSNPLQGIPELLFGDVFSVPDQSACLQKGKWLIAGSPADVEAFCSTTKNQSFEGLPQKKLKFAVYSSGALLTSTNSLTELNVYL